MHACSSRVPEAASPRFLLSFLWRPHRAESGPIDAVARPFTADFFLDRTTHPLRSRAFFFAELHFSA
jgi:hypothetical protein